MLQGVGDGGVGERGLVEEQHLTGGRDIEEALAAAVHQAMQARARAAGGVLLGQRQAALDEKVGAQVLHDVADLHRRGRAITCRALGVGSAGLGARPQGVGGEADGRHQTQNQKLHLAFTLALFAVAASCKHPITVVAGGDLQLGSRTSEAQLAGLSILGDADLRLANLEGPITLRGREGEDKFAASPSVAPWLRGRLEAVSLANNHALDQGVEGRADTARTLESMGIAAVIDERRVKGVTLLARQFAPDDPLDGTELIAAVKRAERPVMVMLHWGHTESLLPSPEQQQLARKLVDAGATAVLGHGPHTIQGVERRGRGVIAYSLGNLAFSCACTDISDAYLLKFRIVDGGAENVEMIAITAGIKGEAPKQSDDPGLKELLEELSRATRPGG